MSSPRITEETIRVLTAIAYLGEATQGQIRARSGMPSGTVSPIVARLELQGWIARREECKGPQTFGRPLRIFFRVQDETAVCAMGARMRDMVVALLEAIG